VIGGNGKVSASEGNKTGDGRGVTAEMKQLGRSNTLDFTNMPKTSLDDPICSLGWLAIHRSLFALHNPFACGELI
jgi:hypothetical protein